MSPASGRFFLDTNIFVYTFDGRSPSKRAPANDLVARALDTRRGVISYQAVQEFLNVATRKFARPMPAPLIVSSAIAGGCAILWTEDLQHRQRIRSVEIRNPFAD